MSRRSPTQPWLIVSHCARRLSWRASVSARCWPAPCPRCRSPAEPCHAHSHPDYPTLPGGTHRPPAPQLQGVAQVALTGRAPALLLLGLVAVVLQPTMTTVRIWWLVTLCAIALDLLLALSPRKLVISRDVVHQVRLGVSGSTTLRLTNPARRPACRPGNRAKRRTTRAGRPTALLRGRGGHPGTAAVHLPQAPAQPAGRPAPARRSFGGSRSWCRHGVRLPARLRDR